MLNLLHSKDESNISPVTIIDVTKAPCYVCETFFQTCNTQKCFPTKFLLLSGHSKIYSGWEFSTLSTIDQAVRDNVWSLVDEIIGTTMHRESRDTIIPIIKYERDEQKGKLGTGEDYEEWKNVVEKLKHRDWYHFASLSFPWADEQNI
jgi:hypothetical protein